MSRPLVLLGAGDHAREIVDLAAACRAAGTADYEVAGYLVDAAFARPGETIDDLPILGGVEWLAGRGGAVHALGAVGAPELRRRLCRAAARHGVRFASLVHPGVERGARIEIGDGVIVAAGSVLTQRIRLGDHAHVNVGCTISHGVSLADHVTLSPAVHLAGNVAVEEGAFLGIGANVLPGVRLGRWSIVGAGAAVIRDVAANQTVVGVPARAISTRPEGWHRAGDPAG